MERIINKFAALLLCIVATVVCSCSESNDEEPEVALSDIAGVWHQTAYLCSDGYFVSVYGFDANYYDFAIPDESGQCIFTQYTLDESGNKEIIKQGEWTYNPETKCAHVEELRGWNLDIYFTFEEKNNAVLEIRGRTATSSSTVKAKLLTK